MTNEKPFHSQHLGKKKSQDVFSVKLNEEERVELDKMKVLIDCKSDSRTLKFFAMIGSVVLRKQFEATSLRGMFNKEGSRKTKNLLNKEEEQDESSDICTCEHRRPRCRKTG